MPERIDFFDAVVSAYPTDADHAPLHQDPVTHGLPGPATSSTAT